MKTLHIDIETYSSVDLRKCGLYRYVESPDFEITLLAYAYDAEAIQLVDLANGEPMPAQLLHDLTNPSITKTAFNAQFEITCLNKYFS